MSVHHANIRTPVITCEIEAYARTKRQFNARVRTNTCAPQIFHNYVFNDMGYGDLTLALLSGGCAGVAEVRVEPRSEQMHLVPTIATRTYIKHLVPTIATRT